MKFFKFLISKAFFLCLSIAGILLFIGYLVLNDYLDTITKHDQKLAVPSLMNQSISEIDQILEEGNFRFEVMDSIWERKLKKGIVLDQKPAPGDSVKEGRKIYVTINARSDKMIKLSLEGLKGGTARGREAIDYLLTNDLVHDSTILVSGEYDDMFIDFVTTRGKVLQDGDMVKAGSRIRIKVSHTKGEEIRVPKVKGMKLGDAVKLLKNSLLNVSVMEMNDKACVEGLDSSVAVVCIQRPECGEDIKVGKEVSLFYTCDSTYKFSRECK